VRQAALKLVLIVLAGVAVLSLFKGQLGELLHWFEAQRGWYGYLLYGGLFVPISFPIFVCGYFFLNLAAGYIYGPWHGFFITSLGTFVGSQVSFAFMRLMCKGYIAKLIENNPSLGRIVRVIDGKHGTKIMMMTRLTPVPIGLQNALFASTSVDHRTYAFASLVALWPTQIMNTSMGASLRSIEEIMAGETEGSLGTTILYLQLVLFCGVTWYVNRKMKVEIDKEVEKSRVATLASTTKIGDGGGGGGGGRGGGAARQGSGGSFANGSASSSTRKHSTTYRVARPPVFSGQSGGAEIT
jgi:uncharacterized membrane protein YdjX (TVP38/TMEM64 family)